MSTDFRSLEESLTSVDVEASCVPPDDVTGAVDNFLRGEAVAATFDRDDITLPDAVTVDPTAAELEAASTGVTSGAFAIADYGSVVLPSTSKGNELVSLFVNRHVVVVDHRDIVADMERAHERFERDIPDEYGSAVIATGPSSTANMGALVKGAHGPREVRVVVVED